MKAFGLIRRFPRLSALALVLVAAATLAAVLLPPPRRGPPQADMAIDAAGRTLVVDALVAALEQHYVFPDKARLIATELRSRHRDGAYDTDSAEELAVRLTDDMRRIGADAHLQVGYSEEALPETAPDAARSDADEARDLADQKRLNFGVWRAERLPFNIGYVDLHAFAPPALVRSRFAAIMTLLGDTRFLILDLRANHGGDPETVALLASYFFDERTHLNDIVWRDGRRDEFFTDPAVDGPRYGAERKVYVLTSADTFSAGEDFAYALKHLGRATIVGETTGGGANPGEPRRLGAHFAAFIPNGRSESPITKANWEGVGVAPDIAVPADRALDVAQTLILKELQKVETDPFFRDALVARLSELD